MSKFDVIDSAPGEACVACQSGTRLIVTTVVIEGRKVKLKVCSDAKKCFARFGHGLTWRGYAQLVKKGME